MIDHWLDEVEKSNCKKDKEAGERNLDTTRNE